MERAPRRRDRARKAALTALAAGFALVAIPATANAATETFRIPITVGGYAVEADRLVNGPRPDVDGHITEHAHRRRGRVGRPRPDRPPDAPSHRLPQPGPPRPELRHRRRDLWLRQPSRSSPRSSASTPPARSGAKLAMPAGYGYDIGPEARRRRLRRQPVVGPLHGHEPQGRDRLGLHRVHGHLHPGRRSAEPHPGGNRLQQDAVPFWLDAENCQADPIYNVPGTGEDGEADENDENVTDFNVDQEKLGATGGRIVAGGGHVHGGAYRARPDPAAVRRPDVLATSPPTWGEADHPFYNVKPILHEPGPVHMSAFESAEGLPIRAERALRLRLGLRRHTPAHPSDGDHRSSSSPPTRRCPRTRATSPLPTPTIPPTPRRAHRMRRPVQGPADRRSTPTGRRSRSSKPPGPTEEGQVRHDDRCRRQQLRQAEPAHRQGRQAQLGASTTDRDLHNITLANGPKAIGSPNLSADGSTAREYSRKFNRPGTYQLFCALHPADMTERVVVKK